LIPSTTSASHTTEQSSTIIWTTLPPHSTHGLYYLFLLVPAILIIVFIIVKLKGIRNKKNLKGDLEMMELIPSNGEEIFFVDIRPFSQCIFYKKIVD
jgi:hypothetical protein